MPYQAVPASYQLLNPSVKPRQLALLVAAVFAACVVGTLTRTMESLAAFWPTNALMLGLLLRIPGLGWSFLAWICGWATMITAALVMGDAPAKALWLSVSNIGGVLAGWLLFSQLDRRLVLMRRTLSAMILLCGCLLASLGSATVGAAAAPLLFTAPVLDIFFLWFTAELMNFMLVLPVVLTATWPPTPAAPRKPLKLMDVGPLISLAGTELLALLIGGPGALLFSVPSLLWCALQYRLSTTAMLCLLVGIVECFAASRGLSQAPDRLAQLVSLRIGLTLMSLGPLAVACAQGARNELLRRLDHAARHDALTGVLRRGAFLEQAQRQLTRLVHAQEPVTVLMFDMDRFKKINDSHGHAAGDDVLHGFARLMERHLRPGDTLGRLGGEEFAALLPGVAYEEALSICQRLCEAVRKQPIPRSDSLPPLHVTVSIGAVHLRLPQTDTRMKELLRQADRALYEAKAGGRDRAVVYALDPI